MTQAPGMKEDYVCMSLIGQLTPKRKQILELLLDSDHPLSAYELLDGYNRLSSTRMPPMSVYRILDYLESQHLVHKLSTNNKYVACRYIGKQHCQHSAQFFVCIKCDAVQEVKVARDTRTILNREAEQAGFVLEGSNFELQGICSACS